MISVDFKHPKQEKIQEIAASFLNTAPTFRGQIENVMNVDLEEDEDGNLVKDGPVEFISSLAFDEEGDDIKMSFDTKRKPFIRVK